jgi:hypothetical protein
LKDFDDGCKNSSAVHRLTGKMLWMISISRNSIVVIIGMILAYVLESKGFKPFKITGMEFNHSITFMFPLVLQYVKSHYKGNSFHFGAVQKLFQIL